MALSGSFYTSTYTGISSSRPRRIYVKWSATQSVANNTSTINVTCSAEGSSSTDWVKAGPVRVYVNNELVISRTDRFNMYKGTSIGSGSTTVTHNSDGTKAVSIKAEIAIYSSSINSTYSGTITLNTIARASEISSVTNPSTLGQISHIVWKPASTNFKYRVYLECNGLDWTSPILSCKNESFSNSSATTSWNSPNLTLNTPPLSESWASYITNSTSAKMTCKLYTYSNSSATALVGTSTKTFTLNIPSNIVPTLDSFSAEIDNSSNATVSRWGIPVAGYSKAKLTATASGTYGSTIKSFSISSGYSVTINGTSLSYTGSALNAGNIYFTCVAKDSRGRNSNQKTSNTFTVYEYYTPTISSFTISRSESNAKEMIANILFNYAPVNNKNTATAVVYYQIANTSNWIQYGEIKQNQDNTLSGFDETKSYNFRVVLTDALGNSDEQTAFVSTISVLMDFRAGGKGLGIGKISEQDGLDVAMSSTFRSPVTIDPDTMSSTPSLSIIGDLKYNTFNGFLISNNGIVGTKENNNTLWSGAYYMNGSQTANLSENISDQLNGIVLIFSAYNVGEGESDTSFCSHFIPKQIVSLQSGRGFTFFNPGYLFRPSMKYLYIYNDRISGNDINQQSGTSNGITYDNRYSCLRYVIGV